MPDRLAVGEHGGFFQPSMLLQFWGVARHPDDETATFFRLRRAEMRLKGEIAPGLVGFSLMIDPAKLVRFSRTDVPVTDFEPAEGEPEPESSGQVSVLQPGNDDSSILQDFYITFLSDYADVSLGQFKIPVSLEGYGSSSRILFPERSRVSRAFGDRRDIGVRIEKKLGDFFYYYAGIFSGAGQNRMDDDNEKDVGLRLEVYPVTGLTLGAVGYTTVGERDGTVRDRVEVDVRYDAHDVFAQAEYIYGQDGPEGARVESHGVYGAFGYTLLGRIQPIVRFGFLNPVDSADDMLTFYEGGLNYYLRGREARLALAVSRFVWEEESAGQTNETEAILLAQVSF